LLLLLSRGRGLTGKHIAVARTLISKMTFVGLVSSFLFLTACHDRVCQSDELGAAVGGLEVATSFAQAGIDTLASEGTISADAADMARKVVTAVSTATQSADAEHLKTESVDVCRENVALDYADALVAIGSIAGAPPEVQALFDSVEQLVRSIIAQATKS